ncbi:MAG: hypothetical protein PHC49_14505 [Desulfuromonadaceae bacterium]|nr:hypothetical protein [Desulfuromonadaceae bacterium]
MSNAVYVIIQYEEASMGTHDICPFYGKNDDYCDVGCEYISSYDANMIIKFCRDRHSQCVKYMELVDRFHDEKFQLVTC